MSVHVHVYKVVGMLTLDLNGNDASEACQQALKLTENGQFAFGPPDVESLAMTFTKTDGGTLEHAQACPRCHPVEGVEELLIDASTNVPIVMITESDGSVVSKDRGGENL